MTGVVTVGAHLFFHLSKYGFYSVGATRLI